MRLRGASSITGATPAACLTAAIAASEKSPSNASPVTPAASARRVVSGASSAGRISARVAKPLPAAAAANSAVNGRIGPGPARGNPVGGSRRRDGRGGPGCAHKRQTGQGNRPAVPSLTHAYYFTTRSSRQLCRTPLCGAEPGWCAGFDAALLKTLSKEHSRQVVIAVHDRQLFEYLKLELSPAFAGDSLLTLELSRGPRRDSVCISKRFSFKEEVALHTAA